jgi:hypothetical protein
LSGLLELALRINAMQRGATTIVAAFTHRTSAEALAIHEEESPSLLGSTLARTTQVKRSCHQALVSTACSIAVVPLDI